MRMLITPQHGEPLELVDGSSNSPHEFHGEITVLEGGDDGSVDGWYDAPPSKAQSVDAPTVQGSYWPANISLSQERVITVRGHHMSFDPEASTVTEGLFIERITALAYQPVMIELVDQLGARHVSGFMSAAPVVRRRMLTRTDFSLVFTCPDPLKYGLPIRFPVVDGECVAENQGSAASLPVVEVEGNVTAVSVTLNGHTVAWKGSAANLTLDFANLSIVEGITINDVSAVPPGVSTIRVVTTPANVPVSVIVRPAWR